jgi:prepilin-type N-terminal cleavage/methylation domain-containing protein
MSLPELLVGMVILAVVLSLAGLAIIPWIAAESSRSAVHEAGMLLQRTKAEALSRNHKCRFLVDIGQREMSVLDGNGTPATTDDLLVVQRRIPSSIGFARPDPGAPITFSPVSGSVFEVVFDSAGRVDSGAGEMVVYGGERYRRLTVYGAGGVRYERWDGLAWTREY